MNSKCCAAALLLLTLLASSCSKHEVRETRFPNGQLGEQFSVLKKDDGSFVKDGDYKNWFLGEQPESEGKYVDGNKTGPWKYWFKNGQIKATVNYTRDSLDGAYTEWYENGQKKTEGARGRNKAVGSESSWFSNGKVSAKRNYAQDGGLEGLQTSWDINGHKQSETNFKAGILNGKSQYWNDTGHRYFFREFKEGLDINLPATYKTKSGDILELKQDETYKLTSRNPSIPKQGKLKITQSALGFKDYYFHLEKFTTDSIVMNDKSPYLNLKVTDIVFVRMN